MGSNHFFDLLSLVEEYAFHICETAIFLAFILVYGRMAIRHILAIEKTDKVPVLKLPGSRDSQSTPQVRTAAERAADLIFGKGRHEG